MPRSLPQARDCGHDLGQAAAGGVRPANKHGENAKLPDLDQSTAAQGGDLSFRGLEIQRCRTRCTAEQNGKRNEKP